MTTDEYVSRYTNLVEADELIKVNDSNKYVTNAVRLGLQAFWGASPWLFKNFDFDLVLTTSADRYVLPDNFSGLRMAREEISVMGGALQFYTKEDFDATVPKLSAHGSDTPQACTVYYDAAKGKWYIKFFPKPAGSETIKLGYMVTTPSDCDDVPDMAQGCLDAYIAKKVYPYGHPGRVDAQVTAKVELQRAEIQDRAKVSSMTTMPTGDGRGFYRWRPWT